jgi:hypothetical protein
MNTPVDFRRCGGALRFVPLLLACLFLPLCPLAADTAGAPTGQDTFLGQLADLATTVHDHPGSSAAKNAVDAMAEAFKRALEAGLAGEKYAKLLGEAGKYAKILDYVLKAIKFGDLSVECYAALASGDRTVFAQAFNTLIREALSTIAGVAGGALGSHVGLGAGALAGGGIASIVTGGIGMFAGGWLGGVIAGESAKWVYDQALAGFVTDLGGALFDAVQGEAASGTDPPPPPLLPGPAGPPGAGGGAGPATLKPFR